MSHRGLQLLLFLILHDPLDFKLNSNQVIRSGQLDGRLFFSGNLPGACLHLENKNTNIVVGTSQEFCKISYKSTEHVLITDLKPVSEL